jgi:hypothetical protein
LGHFFTWWTDEIVELAQEAGVSPSFPVPSILATRIETAESFGIIPIPSLIASDYVIQKIEAPVVQGVPQIRETPVNLLVQLCTAPVNPYEYLRSRQRTIHPVTPVHTSAEFKLFNKLLKTEEFYIRPKQKAGTTSKSAKTVNFEKLTRRWNAEANQRYGDFASLPKKLEIADTIFYKIPELLERHYNIWAALCDENATLFGSEAQRKPITDVLADPLRKAQVLPAIPLLKDSSHRRATATAAKHGESSRLLDAPTRMDASEPMTRPVVHAAEARLASQTPTFVFDNPDSEPATRPTIAPAAEASLASRTPTFVLNNPDPATPVPSSSTEPVRHDTSSFSKPKVQRKRKRCAPCRDYGCERADDCPGSGGQRFCRCVHVGPRPPRKRTKTTKSAATGLPTPCER